jgi:DNA-binding response OmpR family regulator
MVIVEGSDELALFNYALKDQGYDVWCTESGADGIAECIRHPPDLLIVEHHGVIRLNGLAICRRLRSEIGLHTLPIIMFKIIREEYYDEAFSAGASACFGYPYDIEQILVQLRTLLTAASTQEHLHPDTRLAGPRTLAAEVARLGHQNAWNALKVRIVTADGQFTWNQSMLRKWPMPNAMSFPRTLGHLDQNTLLFFWVRTKATYTVQQTVQGIVDWCRKSIQANVSEVVLEMRRGQGIAHEILDLEIVLSELHQSSEVKL